MHIIDGDIKAMNQTLTPVNPSPVSPGMSQADADKVKEWSEWKREERNKKERGKTSNELLLHKTKPYSAYLYSVRKGDNPPLVEEVQQKTTDTAEFKVVTPTADVTPTAETARTGVTFKAGQRSMPPLLVLAKLQDIATGKHFLFYNIVQARSL